MVKTLPPHLTNSLFRSLFPVPPPPNLIDKTWLGTQCCGVSGRHSCILLESTSRLSTSYCKHQAHSYCQQTSTRRYTRSSGALNTNTNTHSHRQHNKHSMGKKNIILIYTAQQTLKHTQHGHIHTTQQTLGYTQHKRSDTHNTADTQIHTAQ